MNLEAIRHTCLGNSIKVHRIKDKYFVVSAIPDTVSFDVAAYAH